MASDWREVRISDLGCVVTGRTPPGGGERFFGDAVPFLTPSDMDGRRVVLRTARSLSVEGAQHLSRCLVPRGVGVSCIGWQMGKAVLIDRPTVTNQQINSVVVDANVADPLFVYYALLPRRVELFNLGAGGSRTPILNKGTFERLPFLLPRLDEQRAIAGVLGALDDKIELNRRMNETLEAMARALFKSWCVDFDPVRTKAEGRAPAGMDAATAALFPDGFEESQLGEIPRGWTLAPLPQVIEVNPARTLRRGDIAPYLDMKNMPTSGHLALEWEPRPHGSGARFTNGDTLLARITPCLENGKTAFVDFLEPGQVGWGSTEYIVLRPKPPLPEYFAYLLARSERMRAHAIQSMTGTTGRQRVPASALDHFHIAVPPAEVAEAFERRISESIRLTRANDQQSRTLRELRDTLLPKLLSGELRVRDAENIA